MSMLCIPRLLGSCTPAFSQASAGLSIHASSSSSLDQPGDGGERGGRGRGRGKGEDGGGRWVEMREGGGEERR